MPGFDEKNTVEDYLLQKLEGTGWKVISADTLERESLDEPLLFNSLTRAIRRLNKNEGITEHDVINVVNEIRMKGSGVEGSKQILNYLKTGVPIKFENDKVLRYVNLFDHQNTDDKDATSNEFIVSRQVVYQSGDRQIRADIVLYINGIPIVVIECKNPVSLSVDWTNAYYDIKAYEKAIPELFKYVQIGVAAEQVAKFFPIVPWLDEVKIDEWKVRLGERPAGEQGNGEDQPVEDIDSDKNANGKSDTDSLDAIVEFLSPATLLDIIKNFIFAREERGQQTKVICRYVQYRAANKIVNRVLESLQVAATSGKEVKKKGLTWHWQGSGKTLAMIFAAYKLFNHPKLEKPSIFFIVDRIGLEDQLYAEFTALDIAHPEIIVSSEELRRVIKHDNYKGKRGMMITLIHKFKPSELDAIRKELEQRSGETIRTRRNVIAFIDEGHRSQYDTLASGMKYILKNGFRFAFTGTPISKKGRDTYNEFSDPSDVKKYLDKYFITDSIKDGFTLKIVYQPRLEKEVHLKKELLEAFLSIEEEEIPENIREGVKEDVKKKLNTIKLILENEGRIRRVCQDIAEHFKENIDERFKAMIVTGSREACVIYKNELDKLLPPEYSEVIMTFNTPGKDKKSYSSGKDKKTDSPRIQKYFDELTARYSGIEMQDIRKDIVNNKFKEEKNPRILIVTDMLLYGFDAPVLQTMYLDKPLKEHRLLQAIARTNRPYRDVKEAGVVIDYVGIMKDIKKAFEMYSKEEIRGAVSGPSELRDEFVGLVNKIMALFKDIPKDRYDLDTLRDAVRAVTSDDATLRTFLDSVKSLRKKFELLGSNEVKAEQLSNYNWIMAVYIYYQKQTEGHKTEEELRKEKFVEQYLSKTIRMVHKTTEIAKLNKELQPIEFDENYLTQLEEKIKNKKDRAANIVFTLNKLVLVDKTDNPVYESLVDKVQRLMEKWKKKNESFEEMYKEGLIIVNEIREHYKRKKELGLTDSQYYILLTLEEKIGKKEQEQIVRDSKSLVDSLRTNALLFTGCFEQKTASKEIEKEVRRFLRRNYVSRYNLSLADVDDLADRIMEILKRYES